MQEQGVFEKHKSRKGERSRPTCMYLYPLNIITTNNIYFMLTALSEMLIIIKSDLFKTSLEVLIITSPSISNLFLQKV